MLQKSKMIIDQDGNKRWQNEYGEYHRINGPVVEHLDGSKWWYQNGKRHRTDGPAVECFNGNKYYWVNGKCFKSYVQWAIYCIKNDLWD